MTERPRIPAAIAAAGDDGAVNSIAGSYLGAGLVQRVPQSLVRKAVTPVGLASAVWLLWAAASG